MSFTLETAREQLASSLLDARSLFGEDGSAAQGAALDNHLRAAAADFNRVRPRIEPFELTLIADQADYPAPAGALRFHLAEMVDSNALFEPYDPRRQPQVPLPLLIRTSTGRSWRFRPVPTQRLISALGCRYRYTAIVAHVLADDANDTTFADADLPLLVMRAQVESLRALAIRNAHKPFTTRDPSYGQTRNSTPAALAQMTLDAWEVQVREGFRS